MFDRNAIQTHLTLANNSENKNMKRSKYLVFFTLLMVLVMVSPVMARVP